MPGAICSTGRALRVGMATAILFCLATPDVQASTSPDISSAPACTTSVGKHSMRCFADRLLVNGHNAVPSLRRHAPGMTPAFVPATPSGYQPADIQSAYNLPAGNAGTTVAIVDAYDDPTAESDLATYRAQWGQSACTTGNGCFTKLNQDGIQGSYPAVDNGWDQEISLDLDAVSAACPNCDIMLVEADSSDGFDLYTAVETAVTAGATIVSMSWGGTEYPEETSDDSLFNQTGVAMVAAAGDNGFNHCMSAAPADGVCYPAASPYVTAVGGTSLTSSGGWTEQAWTDSGGGCSFYEAYPGWQGKVCPTGGRLANDVAAVGDPQTGLAAYCTCFGGIGWAVVGGTSLSTPIIAATYALGGGEGNATGAVPFYRSTTHDITSGSNGSCSTPVLCHAITGHDGPTGVGTPNGTPSPISGPVAVTMGKNGEVDTSNMPEPLPGPNWGSWSIARDASFSVGSIQGQVLDGYGGLHAVDGASGIDTSSSRFTFDIARAVQLTSDPHNGYILDGYGGIHSFGSAPGISNPNSRFTFDIARDIALDPCDATERSGYVLDGYGGIHAFAAAGTSLPPALSGSYWGGWDIAKRFAMNSCGPGNQRSGYVVDGYGGLHPFGTGAAAISSFSSRFSFNIARDIAVTSDGSGYVLDGYGGVHPFGSAPGINSPVYYGGSDFFRALCMT